MSFINKTIWKHYPPAKARRSDSRIDTFTVRLTATGECFGGLHVEDSVAGPRDVTMFAQADRKGAMGTLISPGAVTFVTPNGKKWTMRLNEFQFVFNGREHPQPKFTNPTHKIKQVGAMKEAA